MSTASKMVLGVSVGLTLATVIGVHVRQNGERARLREGVVRDLERLQRKEANLRQLEEQIVLTKRLEAERDQGAAASQGP